MLVRRTMPLFASLLVACALPAFSQAEEPLPDPETLLTDIGLLEDVETLQLAVDQIEAVLPRVEEIQTHVQRIADLRTQTSRAQGVVIRRMRRSLAADQPPLRSDHLRLGRALQRLERQVAVEDRAIQAQAAKVLDELTPTQRNLIETEAEQEARLRRLEALGGHTRAADFVVDQLEQMRELLPDEYVRRRLAIADNILARVEPMASPRVLEMRQTLLELMDAAYELDVAQFEQRRDALPRDVTVRLGLDPAADVPPTEGKLTQEEFQEFLTSPRTASVLRDLLAWRPGRTVPLE